MDEVTKYAHCYEDPNYKMGKRRMQWMKRDIDSLDEGVLLLDIGSGRGETVEYAQSQGIEAHGLDIVEELNPTYTSFNQIPIRYDVVTCYDVLEHIPPQELMRFLDNVFDRGAKRYFLTVSANKAEKDGMTLHLSIHPPGWWEDQFDKRLPKNRTMTRQTYCTEKDWHWIIER